MPYQRLYQQCKERYSEYAIWPSYFERRYLEFLSLKEIFPEQCRGRVLEVGCGIGYMSAFLSVSAEEVVATDLAAEDSDTHSPGLEPTRSLLSGLTCNNVTVVDASAEKLPFPDNSFDMVFSFAVLEHVPDRQQAVSEIFRVLRPGGVNFCLVPTSMQALNSLICYYFYLAKRAVHHLRNKLRGNRKGHDSKNRGENSQGMLSIAKNSGQLTHFPFPPPHGEYKSVFEEVREWRIGRWREIISAGGQHQVSSVSTIELGTHIAFISLFFPALATSIYKVSRSLDTWLGKLPVIKHLGTSVIFTVRKKQG